VNKPYNIKSLDTAMSVGLLDNLLTILFNKGQDKEHRFLQLTGASVVPAASSIAEKEFVLAANDTDGWFRIYTKIEGNLKYIALT